MTKEEVEQRILEILQTEKCAAALSAKVFAQDGLFSQLASTKDERRELIRSPLYKQAQSRFRELQFQEAEAFRRIVA